MPDIKNTFGLTDVKHIVAVSSCKGGVGKSTVAAGLARALAASGLKVGLLDADIYGPSLPTLFNLPAVEVFSNEFKMIEPVRAEGIKLMSFGFLLGDAPAVMRGPIVTRYIQQLLLQTAWGDLDYLIIDMPPGTGDVQLTITQSARLSGAVIVTTRQTLSLVDVARGILMFEKVSVPVLGVVDNMAYYVCGRCTQKHYLFGSGHTLQERFGVKTLVEIPLIPSLDLAPYMAQGASAVVDALRLREAGGTALPTVTSDARAVHVRFPDGTEKSLPNRALRLNCMCALCVDEITGRKNIDAAKIPPDIAAKEITPLGNYAVGISWSDGHASGIYPYTLLKSL